MNDGAVLFCRGATTTIEAALVAVIGELGYVRTEGDAALELAVATGPRAISFATELTAGHALALAKRLAARIVAPVRVLTAHLVVGKGEQFSCDVRDLTVTAGGAANPGPWAEAIEQELGGDWGEICDNKAYFAVSSLVETALHAVLPDGVARAAIKFAAPPSLGAARLDTIALQARFADRAQITVMGGRDCIRITSAGTTITAFVDANELAILRAALGAVLGE